MFDDTDVNRLIDYMADRERVMRREKLVGQLLAPFLLGFEARWSRTNPDRGAAWAALLRETFEEADAVIAESNRREREGL